MKKIKFVLIILIAGGMTLTFFTFWVISLIPSRKDLMSCFTTKMYEVRLCPGSLNYVPLSQISKYVQKAIILSEDSLFYQHKGFDWQSIEKSAKENLTKGKIKRGGSTITQQLAKNLYLTKEKSLIRKLAEAFITLQIEKNLTKKEILEKYLNVIEFGKNIYGIKAAAEYYFNKKPSELDVIESSFLAMLLPNPIKYSKSFKNNQLTPFAYARVKTIIENLYNYQRIEEQEYQIAMSRLETFLSDTDSDSKLDSEVESDSENKSDEDADLL
jgi:monofunctional biosynthetic peptidoglycan transglycosylase